MKRAQNFKNQITACYCFIATLILCFIIVLITICACSNKISASDAENSVSENISKDEIDSEDYAEYIENPNIVIEYIVYKVKSNDNFWTLSKEYYGDVKYYRALAEYNNYDVNNILLIGEEIIIPNIENEKFIQIYEETKNLDIEENIEIENLTENKVIKAGDNNEYQYGIQTDPTVDITIPSGDIMKNHTEEVDTSGFEFLGKYSTTGYTPGCVHCCGNNKGIGASGVPVICGYSVAAPKHIPMGTTLYIEGYGFYVVEDRGNFGDSNIDIACPSHDACAFVTSEENVNVYIVPNN